MINLLYRSLTATAVCVAVAASVAVAQNRDVRSERLVLDDNSGNTIILRTGAGITGGTLTIPDPAGSASFLISAPPGGSQTLFSHLLPGTNNTYDLGSSTFRWRNQYLSGNLDLQGSLLLGDGTGTDNLTVTTNGGNISLTAGAGNFSLSNSTGLNVATSGDLSDATGTLTAADDFAVNGATVLGDGTGTDNLTVTTNGGNISLTAGAGNFSLSNSTGLNISTSGDLSDATGDLTIADALSQTGAGQVTFSGNVDATNGLDVTTANLTVGGTNFTVAPGTGNTTIEGTFTANGSTITLGNAATDAININGGITASDQGNSIGNNTDAIQLTVDGSGAGATTNTLSVDGRANVVGDAVLNRNVTYSTGTVAAGATITIPANAVMVEVTDDGAAAANAVTMPAGVVGRVLYIFNNDAQALAGGATTPAGQTEQFIFLGGAWRLVN